MLINMNHVLRYAEEKQCYTGAFDTPNLEILMVVIRVAEEREEPVTIQHVQLHECKMSVHIISSIMMRMAKEVRVPVCAMLDHGEDPDYVRRALGLSFSAIMYDDSSLVYEENVATTREVVAMAKACSADVEAEIGIVTGHEEKAFTINGISNVYTGLELVTRYVEDTGIDTLAVPAGTVHGSYATEPKLDFDRVVKIKELIGLPLAMHEGSGINVVDIRGVTRYGTRKINYFFYMSNVDVKAAKKLLEEKEVKYFHDLVNIAVDVMEQGVLNAMFMFTLE